MINKNIKNKKGGYDYYSENTGDFFGENNAKAMIIKNEVFQEPFLEVLEKELIIYPFENHLTYTVILYGTEDRNKQKEEGFYNDVKDIFEKSYDSFSKAVRDEKFLYKRKNFVQFIICNRKLTKLLMINNSGKFNDLFKLGFINYHVSLFPTNYEKQQAINNKDFTRNISKLKRGDKLFKNEILIAFFNHLLKKEINSYFVDFYKSRAIDYPPLDYIPKTYAIELKSPNNYFLIESSLPENVIDFNEENKQSYEDQTPKPTIFSIKEIYSDLFILVDPSKVEHKYEEKKINDDLTIFYTNEFKFVNKKKLFEKGYFVFREKESLQLVFMCRKDERHEPCKKAANGSTNSIISRKTKVENPLNKYLINFDEPFYELIKLEGEDSKRINENFRFFMLCIFDEKNFTGTKIRIPIILKISNKFYNYLGKKKVK